MTAERDLERTKFPFSAEGQYVEVMRAILQGGMACTSWVGHPPRLCARCLPGVWGAISYRHDDGGQHTDGYPDTAKHVDTCTVSYAHIHDYRRTHRHTDADHDAYGNAHQHPHGYPDADLYAHSDAHALQTSAVAVSGRMSSLSTLCQQKHGLTPRAGHIMMVCVSCLGFVLIAPGAALRSSAL
jgi:hypothetical protein